MRDTPADRRKNERLLQLLERARHHVMTPAEIDAQRKSWVCGEMLLQYPTMKYEDASARYDAATASTPAPEAHATAPVGWKLVPIEPTTDMRIAWNVSAKNDQSYFAPSFYADMLAAVPAPPENHTTGWEDEFNVLSPEEQGKIRHCADTFGVPLIAAYHRAKDLDVIEASPSPQTNMATRLVIVESPFAGDVEANTAYARAALRDCLDRGEAPYASHLLYTQPGVLDDCNADQRRHGIEAGLAWGKMASATVVYTDRGISSGMQQGIDRAVSEGRPVEYRTIAEVIE